MNIKRPAYRRGRIEMIPLIDCMFIVLVFFIYAMLSMTVNHGIEVQLPTIKASKVNQTQPLTISVKADGTLALDKKPVTLSQLTQALNRRAAEGVSVVLIDADRNARHGMVTRVYRRVGQAKIDRMVILTDQSKAKPTR